MNTRPLPERIAGSSISGGICEVLGWELWLPVDRILKEVTHPSMAVAKFGTEEWLPLDVHEALAQLTDATWDTLARNLARVDANCAEVNDFTKRSLSGSVTPPDAEDGNSG